MVVSDVRCLVLKIYNVVWYFVSVLLSIKP